MTHVERVEAYRQEFLTKCGSNQNYKISWGMLRSQTFSNIPQTHMEAGITYSLGKINLKHDLVKYTVNERNL